MGLFNILPGHVRTPPGLERVILRRIPRIFLVGTTILALPSLIARLVQWVADEGQSTDWVTAIDICALSLFSFYWHSCLLLSLSAFIVMVMKGPAYVADAYPLPDADAPRRQGPDD